MTFESWMRKYGKHLNNPAGDFCRDSIEKPDRGEEDTRPKACRTATGATRKWGAYVECYGDLVVEAMEKAVALWQEHENATP